MNNKTNQFITKATAIHKDKYTYHHVEYVNTYSKIIITCPIHGNFEQTPNSHLMGNGCKLCAVNHRVSNWQLDTARFISKANVVHNHIYDYSKSIYTKSSGKLIITCPIHGDFQQTANSHLSGINCKRCSLDAKTSRSDEESFIKKANIIHKNKYTYDNMVYKSTHTKIKITCPIHGDFEKTPNNHTNYHKQGCPICANEITDSKGVKIIEEFLLRHDIVFVREKSFLGCEYKKLLRYDFYIPNHNLLIEFDGSQHFEFIEHLHKTTDRFEVQVLRDSIKTKYALDNDINLIRIKYNQIIDIPKILSNAISATY